MSDAEPVSTELKAQYGAQVAADLERNVAEQERVAAELTQLQKKLEALRNDHALLVNLQQTLTTESSVPAPSVPRQVPAGAVPVGRKKSTPGSRGKDATGAKQPTLVELIRAHLLAQAEPRSAAEITDALTRAHPGRDIKPKVVRTTVEGLVARGRVHRSKQGSSVFYTASRPEADADAALAGTAARGED